MACLVEKKDKSFFCLFPGRGGTKAERKKKRYQKQPPLPLSSAKEKDGTRAQTHVSKVWQQRGGERDETGDEKREWRGEELRRRR